MCINCKEDKGKEEYRFRYTNRKGEPVFNKVCITCTRKLSNENKKASNRITKKKINHG